MLVFSSIFNVTNRPLLAFIKNKLQYLKIEKIEMKYFHIPALAPESNLVIV